MKELVCMFLGVVIGLSSCIGDDYVDDRVDPVLRISNPIDSIAIDSNYQFSFTYLNNVGIEENINPVWSSSAVEVISITMKD